MTTAYDLAREIDKLVESKTFSLDALEAIKKLRDGAAEQTALIENLRKDFNVALDINNTLRRENAQLKGHEEALKALETDLIAREAKANELDKKTAVAEASLNAFREVTGMFLKNTIVRENVHHNRQIPVPSGSYLNSHSENESRTTETE